MQVEELEVALGLPRRVDRRGEGVHERVHVGRGEVVLLVPGGRRAARRRRAAWSRSSGSPPRPAGRACPPAPRRATRPRTAAAPRGSRSPSTLWWVPSRLLAGSTRCPWPRSPSGWSARAPACAASSAGASTSSIAELQAAVLQRGGDVRRRRRRACPPSTAAVASSARSSGFAVELRVERHPAQPGGLRDRVGGVLAGEVALWPAARRASRRSSRRCATGRCACTSTTCRSSCAAGATSRARWPARSSR